MRLQAKGLSKRYGNRTVVQDVSFSLKAGQTLALIGGSGSGKTTTLRMLNRLVTPDEGEVYFDGVSTRDIPGEQLRRKMGYVIQQTGLFPHYSVFENIAAVAQLLNWPPRQIHERVELLLSKLGLNPNIYWFKYPEELSGGQQQRVGLARALMTDPPILLMDEPFGALDPITRQEIRREFLLLDEFRSKTIVLVTHDVTEAVEMANYICLMNEGKVVQIGKARDFLFRPANDYVRDFFKEHRIALLMEMVTMEELAQDLHFSKPMYRVPLKPPPERDPKYITVKKAFQMIEEECEPEEMQLTRKKLLWAWESWLSKMEETYP
ncbi:MAG: ABC transporter ATP-binding protein [Bacteroidota bacterium]